MKLKATLIFGLVIGCMISVEAQYIVTLEEKAAAKVESWANRTSNNVKLLDDMLNVYLIGGQVTASEIKAMDGVIRVEKDEELQLRSTPNDLFYPDQYGLDIINMPAVWRTLTDAVDFGGREIVVAVIDDGFQVDHPDLRDNIYVNENEIPDNGIDDDNNGLVDDYRGWNIDTNNDNHSNSTHGTSVAGIIGGSGNNDEGITGVAWKIKIFPISGVNLKSEIIRALATIRDLRRQYNESNGNEGVFIVANNYSGGIPGAFASSIDNLTWCEAYNLLGAQGVLSIGATVNSDSDIEQDGDMPSTCTSEYLIVTTNVDQNQAKVRSAGFGSTSVDIGAPGRDIITTDIASSYHNFTGTSASAPHVAGVAGLLYATPCPEFFDLMNSDPALAARTVRDAILTTAAPSITLSDITTTEGILDAEAALDYMQDQCGGSRGDIDIFEARYNNGVITLSYETPTSDTYQLMLSDMQGRVITSNPISVPFFGNKTVTVNVEFLPAGVYAATLSNDDDAASTTLLAY